MQTDTEVSNLIRLQSLIKKLQEDLDSARLKEQEALHKKMELESKLAEVAILNHQLAVANARTAEIMATLEERNQHLKEVNSELARANAYAAELVALVEAKEEEIKRLNKALATANARAAELVADREIRMDQLERLNRRLSEEIEQRRLAEVRAMDLAEQLKIANANLERLATLDPLTDLYNRRGLERLLELEIARAIRKGSSVGVLFADFDDFKSINERFGHACGDHVLRECASRLKRALRATDPVARIGGDEFLAFVSETGWQEMHDIAHRFLVSISEKPIQIGNELVWLTMSVAAGILPPYVTDLEGILRWARDALKRSKDEGKNRVTFIAEQ